MSSDASNGCVIQVSVDEIQLTDSNINNNTSMPSATVVEDVERSDVKSMELTDIDGLRQRKTFSVERPIFNEPDLEGDYDGGPRNLKSASERLAMMRKRLECSGSCIKKCLFSIFPFINIMRHYNIKTDLINDVIAGLTVGIMQIPQGMAYAVLASVQAVYGLYMSFFPIIVYFFLGTSRHLSFGTFAVISLMVGSAVDRLCVGENDPGISVFAPDAENNTLNGTEAPPAEISVGCAMGVATSLTFLGGIMQIGMGLLRLGFVVIYLSEPMTRGFTTGCSIHVFSSQIKSIFGVHIPRHNGALKLVYTYRDLFQALPQTNPVAVLATVISCTIIFVVKEYANGPFKKKFRAPIPIDLFIVIIGTVVSYYGKFEQKFDLEVIGEIPTGIPVPELPPFKYFNDVVADAVVISVVSFAISISMAELFAKRNNYKTDANQELIAHGVTNLVCSNLHCYMMSVSLSRSLVQENVGGVTQIAGLVSSALILVVLLALASLFEALPTCILAAIIVVALKGMFMQMLDLPKLWRVSKTDMSVWLVTFLAVVLLDIDIGLIVGVAWSFLTVVGRTHRPYCTLMGRVGDTDVYVDTKAYSQAKEVPGVKIFRCDNSIYFANREYFVARVYHKVGFKPKKLKLALSKVENKRNKEEVKLSLEVGPEEAKIILEEKWPLPRSDIHHVIIDCSCMGFLDFMGVGGMNTIITEYDAVGVTVFLAACKPGVMETLENSGFHTTVPRTILFPTVHDAVLTALKDTPSHQQMLDICSTSENSIPPAYEYKVLPPQPEVNQAGTGSVAIVSEVPSKVNSSDRSGGVENKAFDQTDDDDTQANGLNIQL